MQHHHDGPLFDNDPPIEPAHDHDPLRDSHDLSFAEGAAIRASVVDNMLLSLDQFTPAPARDDGFLRDLSYRPPGHTYTSSQSSDYSLHADPTPRYTTTTTTTSHAPARRSNSSTSLAFTSRQPPGSFARPSGHRQGTGRKSSKSSTSSSMDLCQSAVVGNQRIGFGKRSASFDHSGNERSRIVPVKVESVLDRGRMAYQNDPDEYDAAPEPTIPAGPRRLHESPLPQSHSHSQPHPSWSAALTAQSSFAPSPPAASGRRNSIRSNTSYRTIRKGKSQVDPSMRAQAQEFVNASTLRDLTPTVSAFQDPPALSPAIATRKPQFPTPAPVPAPAPIPQQKPGFFRRVFGGGPKASPPPPSGAHATNSAGGGGTAITATTATTTTTTTTTTSTTNTTTTSRDAAESAIESRAPEVDTAFLQSRPRTIPNHNTPTPTQPVTVAREAQAPPPPSLAKKPSSFFRRRKKSVSENGPPPIMTLDFTPPTKPIAPGQPSPGVSSLRQVMIPYLNREPREQQAVEEAPHAERPSGFSPGYKPHKAATVRTVPAAASSLGDENAKPLQPAAAATASAMSQGNTKASHATHTGPQQVDSVLAADSRSSGGNAHQDDNGRPWRAEEERAAPNTGSQARRAGGDDGAAAAAHDEPPRELQPVHNPVQSRSGSVSQSAPGKEDQGWGLTQHGTTKPTMDRKANAGAKQVWLDTALAKKPSVDTDNNDLELPSGGARSSQPSLDKSAPSPKGLSSDGLSPPTSPNDAFHSATSLPIVQVESRASDTMPSIIEDRSTHPEPTDADRERALQIYSGAESAVPKAEAAAMLGDVTLSSMRTRKAFMDLFDWAGFTILAAMRDLCGRMVLKAETQQVDRILMSLSERWCECNRNHGFKAVDVVHTICYSILLLNTDLHMADIESRMTRSQFVKNTLPTVTRVCQDAAPAEDSETLRPQPKHFRRPSLPWNDKSEPPSPSPESTAFPAEGTEEPTETRRARSRLSIRPPARAGSDGALLSYDSATGESNTLINMPYNGPIRGWEIQIEVVLKEFYDSIRKQRLPLHGASTPAVHTQPSNNSLSVSNMLRRTPSVLSKAPSDNTSYRSRAHGEFRTVGSRWATKNRSKQKLYPSTVASSRTSLDDGSVWSPAGSSTWSRYSYGKTGTSMSMDSLGSHFASGDYQQAIGFANALSQAIIREEGMTIASDEEFSRVAPLLEDETLELVGAPWAKEGILKHKHHLESSEKKAKDRAWSECFAVVEKGYMRLFSFNMNSKSVRNKSKLRPSAGGVVGGGNWMDNAEALESFPLRQTIASALPPPGYSKSRPYVFALSLPTGAVHLFQVGTPDIVREFVCTANYWSARLSKEPLMGGVSSMEYGWGETVINPALLRKDSAPSVKGHMPRPSVTSSLRSSMDHATGTPKARLAGDKVMLSDWKPPTSSMMASNLMEVDQLRALTDYVKNIENELAHHNELRAPMLIAFSPRHPNAARAMANWERKSQYLLREIVKFRTYIDTLTMAQTQKQKIYADREARGEDLAQAEAGAAEGGPEITGEDGANEASHASDPLSQKPTLNLSLPPTSLLYP